MPNQIALYKTVGKKMPFENAIGDATRKCYIKRH